MQLGSCVYSNLLNDVYCSSSVPTSTSVRLKIKLSKSIDSTRQHGCKRSIDKSFAMDNNHNH